MTLQSTPSDSRADEDVTLRPPNFKLGSKSITSGTNCDDAAWCWDSGAPGEYFVAISSDGKYAVGGSGAVFDTAGVYLERPPVRSLVAVVSHEDDVWGAGDSGVWRKVSHGWEKETSARVLKLVVDKDGTVWGPVRDGGVMRRRNGEWAELQLPRSSVYDATRLLDDITTHEDSRVWVAGTYLTGRAGDGTVLVFREDEWLEYPSNQRTGSPKFLAGAEAPYMYAPGDGSEGTVVYAPNRGWASVAITPDPNVQLLFWSPDGQLWKSSYERIASFDDEDASLNNTIACNATVAWDDQTVLCARVTGGLSYLSPGMDGALLESQPTLKRDALDPQVFGALPTQVWAQDATAWASAVDDVWKAPLDHYDGVTWRSYLPSDEEFEPFRISGTGSSDVWFLSERELRHWDGTEASVVALPTPESSSDDAKPSFQLVTVHAFTETDVWVMRQVQEGGTTMVEFLHGDGSVWETSYRAVTEDWASVLTTEGVVHNGGTFTGSPNDLWATFGQSVFHFDGSDWSSVWRFPSEEGGVGQLRVTRIIDAAADGDELWLSTDTGVYLLRNGEITVQGYEVGLPRLSLSADYVWNFDGERARYFARD